MPDRTFNRIQKVEVGVHPIHCCLFIRDFVKIISYVQTLGATLRTFILDVRLVGHVIREEQMDQVMQIGHSKVRGLISPVSILPRVASHSLRSTNMTA